MTAASIAIEAFAGFVTLALAMARHYAQLFQAREILPARRHALRCAGWSMLAASGVQSVLIWDWASGTILWCGILSAAALATSLGLCYAPRATSVLAGLLLCLALLDTVIGSVW